MKRYAQIADEKTKLANVGMENGDKAVYQALGLELMDVEQAYDGQWYVKGYAPAKPQSLKEEEVRKVRDSMINSMSWRIERAKEHAELGLTPVDDYKELLEYRQYLRDYPEKVENWWEQQPMTYEDWTEENTKETETKEEE